MDDVIKKLQTPEDCYRFIDKYSELISQARQRAIDLKMGKHQDNKEVEKELLKAIYAYEEILTKRNGRRTRANRTWQMVQRHGIKGAAERAVNRPVDPIGYTSLIEMGFENLTFEAVILRFPGDFSAEAVNKSRERIETLEKSLGKK